MPDPDCPFCFGTGSIVVSYEDGTWDEYNCDCIEEEEGGEE